MDRKTKPLRMYKMIVKPSEPCLQTLRFVNSKITEINRLGIVIKVVGMDHDDFTAEIVDGLHRAGVANLPALVPPDGSRSIIGYQDIIATLTSGISRATAKDIASPECYEDYAMGLMTQGMKTTKSKDGQGKSISFTDDDHMVDESDSFMRDLDKHKMAHRQPPTDDDDDPPPARPTTRPTTRPPADNIADDYDDDALHDHMFQALMGGD